MRLTVLNVSYPLAPVSPATAGGAEQVLLTLDEALINLGHRSLVIAPAGSRTHGLLLPTPAIAKQLDQAAKERARREHAKAVERALQSFQVDVVHLHGIDFLDYLPAPGVPVVVTLHLPPAWYDQSAFELDRAETYLVCVSESQRKACPVDANIAKVVPNGVPACTVPVREKGNYLLAMGRICPEKNFHLALDAATRSRFPLFLAGQVFDYPEHRAYFEQSIRPRLREKHKFLGSVGAERKQHLLAGARCLLLPSTVQETSSLVAMEALACGTPVVAFRVGALPGIVDHGRTGFLVDSLDAMAEAIFDVGSLKPENCVHAVQTRFSARRMVADYLELYKSVLTGSTCVNHEVAC